MRLDDGEQIAEPCPSCGGRNTVFDSVFRFWKCDDCSSVWAYDTDDPDYDELEDYDICPVCQGTSATDSEADCPGCGGSGYVPG